MKKILLFMLLFTGYMFHYEKAAGQEITLNFIDEPKTIDPQLATDTSATKLIELLSEGLTREDENGNAMPGIAEKWDVSKDGLVWTFHLRDAKWENGSPVTADDFKFAWLRALDPKVGSEYVYMLYEIKGAEAFNTGKGTKEEVGIKVIDSKTLEVRLKHPVEYFSKLVSFSVFKPTSEKYFNGYKEKYGTEIILSNGPYKLVKWKHNDILYLKKNENYWDKDQIKISDIKIELMNDFSEALEAFENGGLDVTGIWADQYQEFKDDKRLTPYFDGSVWYLEYNLKNKFLGNKKIRKALDMALDKEELGELLGEMGEPAYGYVPKTIQGVNKTFREEAGDIFSHYNGDEARKLFAEGLKELGMDKAPKISLIFNDSGNNKKIIQYVQEKLRKELGFELDVQSLPFKERLGRMIEKEFDIVLAGWSADYSDALSFMDLWLTDGGNNHASYANPKYDRLIKTAQMSPDKKTRVNAMINAEKILGEEVPISMLYFRKQLALVNPRLKNMKFKPTGSEFYLYDVSVE